MTRRWEWVVGLLLLKSSYLNEREAKKDALSWQDRQLKALHDVQVEVDHKDRMAVLKRQIAVIEEELHQCKLNVKDAVLSLRSGWHLEGVTKYKTNKARVEELKPKLSVLLQSKMQQKTFYKLGMSVTKSMDWKKPPALTHLFEIFAEQADEILEPVNSLANILGGNIEPDLLEAIQRVEAVAPGTGEAYGKLPARPINRSPTDGHEQIILNFSLSPTCGCLLSLQAWTTLLYASGY